MPSYSSYSVDAVWDAVVPNLPGCMDTSPGVTHVAQATLCMIYVVIVLCVLLPSPAGLICLCVACAALSPVRKSVDGSKLEQSKKRVKIACAVVALALTVVVVYGLFASMK